MDSNPEFNIDQQRSFGKDDHPEIWSFRRPDKKSEKQNHVWDFLSRQAEAAAGNDEIPTKKIKITDLFEGPGKHKIKSIVSAVLKSVQKIIRHLNAPSPEKQFRSDLYDTIEPLRILWTTEKNVFKARNQVSDVLKNITEQQCNFLSSIMSLTCEMNKGYPPFWKLGPIAPTLYKWKGDKKKTKSNPPPPPRPRKGYDPTHQWTFHRRDSHLQAEKSDRLWDYLCDYKTSDCKRLLTDIQQHQKRLKKTSQIYHNLTTTTDGMGEKKFLVASAFKSAKKILTMEQGQDQSLLKQQLKNNFLLLISILLKLGPALQEIIEKTDQSADALQNIYQRHSTFLTDIMSLTSEMNQRYSAFWDVGSLAPGRCGWKQRETDKGVMRKTVPSDCI